MRASGAGAVMADRARGEVEADSAQVALWRRHEFFPTPIWAGRAGGELIKQLVPEAETCWEPACGQGHLAYALGDYFPGGVTPTDIVDHAGGRAYPVGPAWLGDFLDPRAAPLVEADIIASNPPFAAGADFVRLALRRARLGVAMLCRAAWFESADRYPLFFGETPLSVYAPFFERVPMTLGRWDPKASTATAYAWFIWLKAPAFDGCRVMPISPGTKARLTRPDDARVYGAKGAAPLFPELGGGE